MIAFVDRIALLGLSAAILAGIVIGVFLGIGLVYAIRQLDGATAGPTLFDQDQDQPSHVRLLHPDGDS